MIRSRLARARARTVVGRGPESGQSTVEFACSLPLLFTMLVLLFQVALVGRDQTLVVHGLAMRRRRSVGDVVADAVIRWPPRANVAGRVGAGAPPGQFR